MILANHGEYMGEGTPAAINEICESLRIGLVSALAERIDFGKEYILSFKEDTYERVTEQGNLMHGIKMMVSADTLVRCKECKFSEVWESTAGNELYCEKQRVCPYDWGTLTAFYVKADDFCSYGERKESKR